MTERGEAMKKFSVLLVLLLLATPLLAYGLTVDRDEGGIPLQTVFYSQKAKEATGKTPVRLKDIQEIPSDFRMLNEDNLPHNEDPFFPEPDGFKGTVVEIDTTRNIIKIADVRYYNNYRNAYDFAEFYTIVFNEMTGFIIDGEPFPTANHLTIGSPITAVGEPDYENQILNNTVVVFQGSIYQQEEQRKKVMPFSGVILSIDQESQTMVVHCSELATEITVSIIEGTCFQQFEMNNEGERVLVILDNPSHGFPPEIKEHIQCDFVGEMHYPSYDTIAHSVIITENN